MNISALEQYMAQHGYIEVLLYNSAITDAPDFSASTSNHIIRARDFTITPRYSINGGQDTIFGQIDHNIFLVDNGEIKGEIGFDLATTFDGAIEHPNAMMYQNLRNAWIGVKDNGNIISPKEEYAGGHPWFSLGSTYHGAFSRCLVDKMTIEATQSDQPIKIKYDIVSLRMAPTIITQIKQLRSSILASDVLGRYRQIVYGRNCLIVPREDTVYGDFGMPDAKSSIFSQGINSPGDIDTVASVRFEISNNLKPVYTMQSRQILDRRKRFEENLFPSGYGMDAQRTIKGTIDWYGSANPVTFIERILGPGSVQNRKGFDISTGVFKISVKNPVWDVSEKSVQPEEKLIRRASFTSMSDGEPIVPHYTVT